MYIYIPTFHINSSPTQEFTFLLISIYKISAGIQSAINPLFHP